MAKKQMTEAERQANVQRLREWRQRKRAEYIASGGEPPKRGRPTVPIEEQIEKKKLREAQYREQKRLEAPPKPPKPPKPPREPKLKKRPKKEESPDPQEIYPQEPDWKAPHVVKILASSKDYEGSRRFCTIEQRQPASRPLRLKVVIFGESVKELEKEARKIGINTFRYY